MFEQKVKKLQQIGWLTLTLVLAPPLLAAPKIDTTLHDWRLSQYWPHDASDNLWHNVSSSFRLSHATDQHSVQAIIQHFSHHQAYLNKLTNNARPYLYFIFSQTQQRGLPAELALLPFIESGFDPFGISHTGATGLWQMMPGTASGLGVPIDWWYDGRRSLPIATTAALNHLQNLHHMFGDWLLALAAYDCGDGTVRSAIRYNKNHHQPTDFWDLKLPKETQRYVPKLLALAAIIADPDQYHVQLQPIADTPYFDGVPLQGQLDLMTAAKMAKISPQDLHHLNPAFRRWATPPSKPYWLLLPVDKIDGFKDALSQQNDTTTAVTWQHHIVQSGDSLSKIGHHFHVKTAILKKINHLKNTQIHIGQTLLIPAFFKGSNIQIEAQLKKIAEDHNPGPTRTEHQVMPHDNLASIAHHYGVSTSQLRYWNNIGYHQKLQPGQTLILWQQHTHIPVGFHLYTVKAGDSLSRIGHHFHVKAHHIKALNHLPSNQLRIGQALKIPYPQLWQSQYTGERTHQHLHHVVRPGQTLSAIAHYYQVSTRQLIEWNHITRANQLRPGQRLTLYLN